MRSPVITSRNFQYRPSAYILSGSDAFGWGGGGGGIARFGSKNVGGAGLAPFGGVGAALGLACFGEGSQDLGGLGRDPKLRLLG